MIAVMKSRLLPILTVVVISALIILGILYNEQQKTNAPSQTPNPAETAAMIGASPTPTTVESPMPTSNSQPDLTVDANGLSKSTVTIKTEVGSIKFKFYPKDAPETVSRMIELIQQGFYNGLTFHRVEPGFVIQGGDPLGNGSGGSGKKLRAEFNARKHIEGTVAMARAQDPNSADSQFYVSMGTHPHLDNNYTVFGQVVEGMDVVKKIRVEPGFNKMISVTVE
jgi:peptidylprolyl isomerase/peptidyl-prolyl cis-trans isomerase B (cyclophilin B)